MVSYDIHVKLHYHNKNTVKYDALLTLIKSYFLEFNIFQTCYFSACFLFCFICLQKFGIKRNLHSQFNNWHKDCT